MKRAGPGRVPFRSVDDGDSWEHTGLAASIIGLGAVGGRLIAASGSDVFVSDDGGGTWSVHRDALGASRAAGRREFRRSTDDGATWTVVADSIDGLPSAIVDGPDGRLYVATFTAVGFGRIYRSDDDGATWTRTSFEAPVLDLHAGTSDLLIGTEFNGIFRTSDGGETWATTELNGTGITALAVPRLPALLGAPPRARLPRRRDGLSGLRRHDESHRGADAPACVRTYLDGVGLTSRPPPVAPPRPRPQTSFDFECA